MKTNNHPRTAVGPPGFKSPICKALRVLLLPIAVGMLLGTHPALAVVGENLIPLSATSWRSVNDGVMGGVSKGSVDVTDSDTLLFTGILSLENDGGFASIRSQPRGMDLSGTTAFTVKVRGDGRTYWFELRGDGQMGASSYRATLPTTTGEWTTTTIPLTDFQLQSYGRRVQADPIDAAAIRSLGFTLADKLAGPFRVEIESVRAVGGKEVVGSNQSANTIAGVATAAGSFETLLAAAAAAELTATLSGTAPLTVFAPTDDAFAKLPEGTVATLLKPENKQQLIDLLSYHVVPGTVTLAQALEGREATTLLGPTLPVRFADGRVNIGSASLIQADIEASNGLIHVIDQVLIPPDFSRAPVSSTSLIELAIERGVPLFNHGNAAACAAVYEVTCQALLAMSDVDEDSVRDLNRALRDAGSESSHRQRAWVLRHALDRTYARLAGR